MPTPRQLTRYNNHHTHTQAHTSDIRQQRITHQRSVHPNETRADRKRRVEKKKRGQLSTHTSLAPEFAAATAGYCFAALAALLGVTKPFFASQLMVDKGG